MYIQSDYYKEDWYNMSIFCKDENMDLTLVHIPIYDHVKEPYISIFKGTFKNYNKELSLLDNLASSKHCRVSMLNPVYLNFPGEDLVLSKEELDSFIHMITTEQGGEFFRVYLQSYYIDLQYYNKDDSQYLRTLPVPDYTKLPTV